MFKTPNNPNKRSRLSIDRVEANLNRHPSVKSLFDEMGNKKTPSDDFDSNNKNDLYSCSIEYNNERNSNIKSECFLIKIDKCDHKILDEKESFYVEADPSNIENNEILNKVNNSKKIVRPLIYQFNDSQKKFDAEVTKEMAEGKDYKLIEQKFLSALKKKS